MAAADEAQGFRPLDEASLVAYIRTTPALAASLGGRVDDLAVKEVGDGNLNFVYIVTSGRLRRRQAGPCRSSGCIIGPRTISKVSHRSSNYENHHPDPQSAIGVLSCSSNYFKGVT
ncbi:hypothetical protein TRIUR3_08387 [Triticum urartu]|uniref:S-methyl-5-thioribose kinase n=1 Tax=Triticum urartu TaxID=4572 RepID=M7ZGD9_TRIUA|nr:hypothetical protein TRIUR3_08387 [Triticum urartu]